VHGRQEGPSDHPLRAAWLLAFALLAALACSDAAQSKAFKTAWPIATATPASQPSPVVTLAPDVPLEETLDIVRSARIPPADPLDLARRLGGLSLEVPPTMTPPATPLRVGAVQRFWITDEDDEQVQVRAVLREISDHAYYWVHDEISVNANELRALAEVFEEQIYPTNRDFFGSEPSPGVDGDPRIYILYARGIGLGVAGYFSSADLVHPLIDPYSNGHEMFVFNADAVELDDPFTYGVLAHEFQHMIHWNVDRDEALWVNEGLAELAVRLNRLDPGGLESYYLDDTDLQLNDWPNSEFTEPHYGASYLFMSYLFDRFGREFTAELVAHPENGLEALDRLLAETGQSDPQGGGPLSADAVVMDWAAANLINERGGPFGYLEPSDYLPAAVIETVKQCGPGRMPRQVSQYGVDYIAVACPGRRTLRFEGGMRTELLPADAHSGNYSFWSNKGDDADMTLTREFDLTGVSAPVRLSYWIWFDIEQGWDYAYLLASADGQSWDILTTPSGTDRNPTGNNYGWGYTGESLRGLWIQEQVDLSEYVGSKVLLRFEYITDGAVFGEGVLIDEVSLPQLGYFGDFEQDEGGWEAQGFVRVSNQLPQTFQVALVELGERPSVGRVPLDSANVADVELDLGRDEQAVLVVIGTTRFTRQPANYTLSFLP
jgi:hypothetical protein